MSRSLAASLICGVLAAACGGSSSTSTTSGTGGHGTGVGGANTGSGGIAGAGAGGTGTAGTGAAGNGTAGSAGSGSGSGGTSGAAGTIPIGGSTGVFSCTPGREELIITDCGYPNATNNPLSSTVFNENEVLRAIRPAGSWPNGIVQMFYNDEHALTLGVRQVGVKTSSGTTTTDYPVTPLATNPGSAVDPQLGTTMLNGVQSGLDASFRPMWPALFITDISNNPAEREGDWQMGGRPSAPERDLRQLEGRRSHGGHDQESRGHDHHARRRSREEQLEPRGRRSGSGRTGERGLWRGGPMERHADAGAFVPVAGPRPRRRSEQGGR